MLSRFCALVLLLQFNKNIVPVTLPGGGGGCSLSRLDFGLTLGFLGKTQSYVALKVSFRAAKKYKSCILTLLYFFTKVKVLGDNVYAIIKSY